MTNELDNESLRIYKIFHLLEMLRMEVSFIDKNKIDRAVYDKLNQLRNQAHVCNLEIKRRTPEYNEIFQDLSNEKIFAMMTVLYKMALLTEQQALEFEKSLEIEDVKPIENQ